MKCLGIVLCLLFANCIAEEVDVDPAFGLTDDTDDMACPGAGWNHLIGTGACWTANPAAGNPTFVCPTGYTTFKGANQTGIPTATAVCWCKWGHSTPTQGCVAQPGSPATDYTLCQSHWDPDAGPPAQRGLCGVDPQDFWMAVNPTPGNRVPSNFKSRPADAIRVYVTANDAVVVDESVTPATFKRYAGSFACSGWIGQTLDGGVCKFLNYVNPLIPGPSHPGPVGALPPSPGVSWFTFGWDDVP